MAIKAKEKGIARNLFEHVVKSSSSQDSDSQKSYIEKVKAAASEEKDDSSEEGPTSLAEAFRIAREKGDTTKRKVQKSSIVPDDEDEEEDDGPDLKITVPKKKIKDETEEEEGEEEEEKKPVGDSGKKKAKKEESQKEDEGDSKESDEDKALREVLELDESSLVNKQGQPISKNVAEHIKTLKKHLDYYAKRAKKLAERKPDSNPELEQNYKDIKSAHEELKKKFNDKYFEETPEWEENFIKPLELASNEMGKWMTSHDFKEGDDEIDEMEAHRIEIEKAMRKGDEVKYYEHIDAISDFLKKGSSARFTAQAPKLWDAFQAKEKAFKDKEAARKSVNEKLGSYITDRIKESDTGIDSSLASFEERNKPIIEAYRNDKRFRDFIDYDNTVVEVAKSAKTWLQMAVRDRKVTPQLTDLVMKGVLMGLKEKEIAGHLERIRVAEETIARLEEKLGQRDEALDKVRPTKKRRVASSDDDEEEAPEHDSFAALFKARLGRKQ